MGCALCVSIRQVLLGLIALILQRRYESPFSDENTEALERSRKTLQVQQLQEVKQECDPDLS